MDIKRIRTAAWTGALAGALVIGGVVPSATAAPYCGITWGSLAEQRAGRDTGRVFDVRAGRHTCFDRLVLDLDGDAGGWTVRYVDQVVRAGSGTVQPVRGGARLEVVPGNGAVASDAFFIGRGAEVVDTMGYRTFREVSWASSDLSQAKVALGVRARLPFRVLVVDGPGAQSRLVVDVAHRW